MVSVKILNNASYLPVYKAMRKYTSIRDTSSVDAIWLVEHRPVYTLGKRMGLHDLPEKLHPLAVQTDRGGEVTWHGPGQLCVYALLNIKALGWTVKSTVENLLRMASKWLQLAGIDESLLSKQSEAGNMGLYCRTGKIVSIGMSFKKFYSYHGISINVTNEFEAFNNLEICGVYNRKMARVIDEVPGMSVSKMAGIIQCELLSKQSSIFSSSNDK